MVKDPVCGMDVDERTSQNKIHYKDKSYYFCCEGCKVSFEKNPERYLDAMSKKAPENK